jgi:PAS domain S-box-containing protein
MLAESLERLGHEVVRQFELRCADLGFGSQQQAGRPTPLASKLLHDVGMTLRRGHVQPAHSEAAVAPRDQQCPQPRDEAQHHFDASLDEYGLLADCIHDLIERHALDVPSHEMRLLSRWLITRACAPALARAARVTEQNRRLAALLDAVPDPLSAVNREGRLCYLNRASLEVAHAVSGVPMDQIAGKSMQELGYPSASVHGHGDDDLAKARTGSTITTEVPYPTPTGVRWFEQKVSPIYREDGSVASFAAISRDIDDRRRAQVRLSLLSKLGSLAGLMDYKHVLSAVARLSIPEFADWCLVDVLEDGEVRIAEVAHRDAAKARLADALPRLPIQHPARRNLPAARAFRTGAPLLIPEYTLAREQTEGEYFELLRGIGARSAIAVPLELPSSLAVMTFLMSAESGRRYGPEDLALAVELTKRAAQIVEIARVHELLRKTEERFRVALAHSKTAVFEQDATLRYRWIYNPQPGIGGNDVLGENGERPTSAEEGTRLTELSRAVLRTGEGTREEVQVPGTQGPRHLLLALEPLRAADGTVTGITGAATDITEQKRAQEELSHALAFRDRVMGILGHDLRSPLAAVRALASLLLRREGLPENVRESLAEIDRAGKRMLDLIATLLDFTESRFKGILPIAPAPTDMHELCRSAIDELLAAHPGRSIDIDVEGDARGAWDPTRLSQVVSNLIGNALQHGARFGPVRVSIRGDEEEVVLRVDNEGPPIAPELASVLFEPFRGGSTEPGSRSRGLGLGLYIVRQIVNAHGGEISVESTAERGTAFIVSLPRTCKVPLAEKEAQRPGWHDEAPASA